MSRWNIILSRLSANEKEGALLIVREYDQEEKLLLAYGGSCSHCSMQEFITRRWDLVTGLHYLGAEFF